MAALLVRILGSHEDWRYAEVVVGLVGLAWAIQVFTPPPTFSGDATYRVMLVPEWVWASLFGLQSCLTIYSAGARVHRLRRLAAVTSTFLWLSLGTLTLTGNPGSGLGAMSLMMAMIGVARYSATFRCHVVEGHCNGLTAARLAKLLLSLKATSQNTEDSPQDTG